jgi:hypothetical protein
MTLTITKAVRCWMVLRISEWIIIWKSCGSKRSQPNLRYSPVFFLDEVMETIELQSPVAVVPEHILTGHLPKRNQKFYSLNRFIQQSWVVKLLTVSPTSWGISIMSFSYFIFCCLSLRKDSWNSSEQTASSDDWLLNDEILKGTCCDVTGDTVTPCTSIVWGQPQETWIMVSGLRDQMWSRFTPNTNSISNFGFNVILFQYY